MNILIIIFNKQGALTVHFECFPDSGDLFDLNRRIKQGLDGINTEKPSFEQMAEELNRPGVLPIWATASVATYHQALPLNA